MSAPCPKTELLSRRLDADLSATEVRELARHVDGCASCRRALAALSSVRRGVRDTRPEAPEILAPKVLQALRREGLVGRKRSPYVTLGSPHLLTLAAGLVLAVGMTLWLGNREPMRLDETTALVAEKGLRQAEAPVAPETARDEAAPAAAPPPATEMVPTAPAAGIGLDGARENDAPAPQPPAELQKKAKVSPPSASDDVASGAKKESVALRPQAEPSMAPVIREAPVVANAAPKQDAGAFAPAPPAAPAPAPVAEERVAADEAPAKSRDAHESKDQLAARSEAPAEPQLRQKAVADTRAEAESAAAPEARGGVGERRSDVVPAVWSPEAGTVWDQPPRWTSAARRLIERTRGGSVALRVTFSAAGKITAVEVLSGDKARGADLVRYLRGLPQALYPAERGGVLVAGAGRVNVGSGG